MSYRHFTPFERGQISAFIQEGKSNAFIAEALNRSPSSIGREVKRNSLRGVYEPERAQRQYEERREACRPTRKLDFLLLRHYVYQELSEKRTPEAIAGRLRLEYPNTPSMRISHETIYKEIYADERLHCLIQYLAQARPKRRKRGQGKTRRGPIITDRKGIKERPPEVQQRSRFGDWEGDLIVGAGQSGYVLTLVERRSLMTLMRKLESKNAQDVANEIIDALMDMPPSWVKTITFDNGSEFADHKRVAKETSADIYFADPYASYQRGTNENTNGRIRRTLPKKMSFKNLTKEQVERIEHDLNNTPRKKLEYQTPREVFLKQRIEQHVALKP